MDPLQIQAFQAIQIQNYMDAACLALYTYDYSCTIIPEISLIWNSPWSIPKGLYIVAKYLPFFTLGVLLYYKVFPSDPEACMAAEKFVDWTINASMCIAEFIFTIRTWAVWGRSPKIAILLAACSVALWVPGFVFMSLWVKTLKPFPIPTPITPSGCFNIPESPFISPGYVLITTFYTLTLSLMAVKAYQTRQSMQGSDFLSQAVYRDGILYYVYLLIFSVVNLATNLTLSPDYANLISKFQQAMCSILACRMMLHLRKCQKQTATAPGSPSELNLHIDSLMFRQTSGMVEERYNCRETDP
ncbi:hypothetical protein BDZ94DRAFT_1313579 [Collybia nuda]|uniref:DUF6533 domain-containing protein n=1 Tax=Collybia nuda TaxID=64659 RepID=A0A9P5XWS5_9AGAR|nr:hypothetical protein BDZ94DRAFT_1313579 [Collybia nuda]